MAGICGLLTGDGAPPDRAALLGLCAALGHRGPDGEGVVVAGPAGLAARRLAIVDAEHGDGPVADEEGAIHVVLDGEILNFRGLRDRLVAAGHRFGTLSDTEVLVHLYEERGVALVRELRGMFALALWDARRGVLLLARDRFGAKPLTYARTPGGGLAFASEARALGALPGVGRAVDPEAVTQFLALGAVLAPRTMLAAVHRLPAGHRLVARSGQRPVLERWARPAPAPAGDVRRGTRATLATELRERLGASVRAHLHGDAPVGALLGGDLASVALAALMARETGRVSTFAAGTAEGLFAARRAARALGSEHHDTLLGPEAAGELSDAMGACDTPPGDVAAVAAWLGGRLAAGHVKAVLSPAGAEQLLGARAGPAVVAAGDVLGTRAGTAAAAERLVAGGRRFARGVGRGPGAGDLVARAAPGRRVAGRDALARHLAGRELVPAHMRAALLGRADAGDAFAAHRARWTETAGAATPARLQDADHGTTLADGVLAQADGAGMAHGVEVRFPYLDGTVTELALALPEEHGARGDALLRAAVAPVLPAGAGRGVPRRAAPAFGAWLRGPLREPVCDVLAEATLRRQGMLDPAAVQALLTRHLDGGEDLARPLWALMALTLWYDAAGAAPPGPEARPAAVPVATPWRPV